nr:DUF2568 domain-containing protein [Motilibacter deserti]
MLELVALACVARWGWWVGKGGLAGSAVAAVSVVAWAVVWGAFLSPRARVPLPPGGTVFARAAMVALAAVGGAVAGWEMLAVALVLGWVATVAVDAAL